MQNNFDSIEHLRQIPLRNKKRDFLIDTAGGRTVTFGELHEKSCRIAQYLQSRNISKGDRVAILMENCLELAELYFGCLYAGAVVVPLNPVLQASEIEYVLVHSQAKALISTGDLALRITSASATKLHLKLILSTGITNSPVNGWEGISWLDLPTADSFLAFQDVTENDDIALVYTSGTTAEPKGVMHRIFDLVQNARLFGRETGLGPDNRFCNILSLTYLGGYYNLLLLPYVNESSVVLSSAFNPSQILNFWKQIIANQVNTLWLVPSIMSILMEMDRGKDGIEYARRNILFSLCGTAPLPVQLRKDFEARYRIPVYENYGLSETFFITNQSSKRDVLDGCVGKVLPGVTVKILAKENTEAEIGQEGEIFVKTPYLMRGYYDTATGNADAETAPEWFATGDLGHLNADNELFITGRKKDLIIRGGINISPISIENVIYRDKKVQDCAVVGIPHPFMGEEIVAVVRPVRGAQFSEILPGLQQLCRDELPKIKVPGKFYELLEFPRNSSGKILKRKIRAWILQGGGITPPVEAVPEPKAHPFQPSAVMAATEQAMSIKFNTWVYELQSQNKDVTVLSLGEAFFDVPLFSFDVLPFPKLYHYSHSRGIPELRKKIAQYFSDTYDVRFDSDKEILLTAGSKIAIYMALVAVINPGDEVLVYDPAWVSYPEQIKLAHGVPVQIPYDTLIHDFDRFITPKTKMIIINNPNNPTGRVYNLEELTHLHQLAKKHNLFILSDEAYSDFLINQEEFISFAHLDTERRHTIVINSISKNFGMSGWRLGYIISCPEVIDQILKLNQHLVTCPPTVLSFYAARYFDEIVKYTRPQIQQLLAKRREIAKYMDQIGLKYLPGESTFYFFVSIEPSKLGSEEFATRLLHENHVCVVPGIGYGKSCDRFVRVSVGSESLERVKNGLASMKALIDVTARKMERV